MDLLLQTDDSTPGHKLFKTSEPQTLFPRSQPPSSVKAVANAQTEKRETEEPALASGSLLFTCNVPGCSTANHRFPNQGALDQHKRDVHKSITEPQPSPTTQPILSTAKRYACKQCPESFDKPWELSRHVRSAHPKPDQQRETVRVGEKYMYPCPQCDKLSSTRIQRDKHVEKVHGAAHVDQPAAPASRPDFAPVREMMRRVTTAKTHYMLAKDTHGNKVLLKGTQGEMLAKAPSLLDLGFKIEMGAL